MREASVAMAADDCDNSDVIRELLYMLGKNSSHRHAFSHTACHLGVNQSVAGGVHEESILEYVKYLDGIDQETSSLGRDVFAYVTPFIIAMGVVGNSLSLCVFLSRRLRSLSASHYLAALSASDTGVLCTYVLLEWLSRGLPRWPGGLRAPLKDTQGICQMFLFLSYTFRFVSVYLIMVFTVERYIAVCRPLQRRMICTRSFAKKLIAIVIFAGVMVSIPKPLLSGVYHPRHRSADQDLIPAAHTADQVTPSFGSDRDNFLYFFPEYRNTSAFKALERKAVSHSTPPVGVNNEPIEQNTVCMRNLDYDGVNLAVEVCYSVLITVVPFALLLFFNLLITRRLVRRFASASKLDLAVRDSRIRWEFTVMLLGVSTCFILLNIPYLTVWVLQFRNSVSPHQPAAASIRLSSYVHLTKTIFYLNYCINFFLYCLTGTHYRSVLREWVRRCTRRGRRARGMGYTPGNHHWHHSPSIRKFSQSLSQATQSTFV